MCEHGASWPFDGTCAYCRDDRDAIQVAGEIDIDAGNVVPPDDRLRYCVECFEWRGWWWFIRGRMIFRD